MQLLLECFKAYGHKFEKLAIVDLTTTFSFNDFFKLVNMCPNLRWLWMLGLNLASTSQCVELNTMEKLRFLTCHDPPVIDCEGYSVLSKIIMKAPKLYYIAANLNLGLIYELENLSFSKRNRVLKVRLHLDLLEHIDYDVFFKILKNMRVKELIMFFSSEVFYTSEMKKILDLQLKHEIVINLDKFPIDRQFPDKWRFEELALY